MTKIRWILSLLFLSGLNAALPPVVLYTDIVDGPKNGGENNLGAYLSIYGKNFGTIRDTSTVTIGGGAVSSYPIWSAGGGFRGVDKIVVQLGPSVVTGAIVVTVGAVPSNNDVTFTVTSWASTQDRVFCVNSATGLNTNNGQFTTDSQSLAGTKGCWQTASLSAHKLLLGDKLYFMPGFQSEGNSDICGGSATINISTSCSGGTPAANGSSGHSIALLGYPGGVAQIGANTNAYPVSAIRASTPPQYWTIGELKTVPGTCSQTGNTCTGTLASGSQWGIGLGSSSGSTKFWRIVANDLQCPSGDSVGSGCLSFTINHTGAVDIGPTTGRSSWILGNYMNNYCTFKPTDHIGWRHTFAAYIGTDANEVEMGWNEIDGSQGYASLGFHVHSSPTSGFTDGYPIWGFHFHNNLVHDTPAGNDMTLNPGKGSGAEFYNNVFAHQGDCFDYPNAGNIGVDDTGWNQGFRRNSFANIGIGTLDYNWAPLSGQVKFYNNTVYDMGNCTGTGGLGGFVSILNATNGGSTVLHPPSYQGLTICASACSLSQSGTLPATGNTPVYSPLNVGFQVNNNTVAVHNVLDDGLGNLIQYMQNGVELASPVTIGTICYDTNNPTGGCVAGAYSFTLSGIPLVSTYQVKFWTVTEPPWDFKNNVVYQRNNTTGAYVYNQSGSPSPSITFLFGRLSGDHNLFYSIGGQTVPVMFTTNIGANTDPLFVSNGVLGTVPSNGDYHPQARSPLVGAGVTTTATRDYDGNLRTMPFTVGALQPIAGGSVIVNSVFTGAQGLQ